METLLRAGLSNAVAASFMAILVLLLSRPLLRRPAIVHGLWLLVLIKLVTPPIYEVPIPWPVSSPPPASEPPAVVFFDLVATANVAVDDSDGRVGSFVGPADQAREARGLVSEMCVPPQILLTVSGLRRVLMRELLAMVWVVGAVAVLVVSLRRIGRFRALLKEARGGSWLEQDWVDEWARRLGLRRAPELLWVPGPISPMVWFVGVRPRLILPAELWKRLDARQRSTLLAHELAHLRRGDHLVRLLELLVTALFWWHPLVWWMRGPLREVEEQCCDAWVVWALPDAARAYAETLLDTLEFLKPCGRPDPLLASGLGKVPHLRRRLTMIMTGTSRRSPGLPGRLGLLLAAGVMLPVGASWAQKADETKTSRIVITNDSPQAIDTPVGVAPGEVSANVRITSDEGSPGGAAVVVKIQGEEQPGQEVDLELSGSLEDVIKGLEKQIALRKAKADSSEAARREVKALVDVLESLKKTGVSGDPRIILNLTDRTREEVKVVHSDSGAKVSKGPSDPNQAGEVARARQEVSRLKGNLKETLDQLAKAQARLRELGEDPGEKPVVGWHRSETGTKLEQKTYIVRSNVSSGQRKPSPNAARADERRYVIGDGAISGVRPEKAAGPLSDLQRLEQLDKKLKALQEEFDRLKKGTASPALKR